MREPRQIEWCESHRYSDSIIRREDIIIIIIVRREDIIIIIIIVVRREDIIIIVVCDKSAWVRDERRTLPGCYEPPCCSVRLRHGNAEVSSVQYDDEYLQL